MRQFAETCFDNLVELNFELEPALKSLFGTLQPADIVRTIALTRNVTITPDRTLLFLDEIQECPQAIMALRYFYEHMPELHVIGASSLLEFTLRSSGFQMPVGRIQCLVVSFEHGMLSVPLYVIDQLPRLIREVSHGQAR